VVLLLAAPPECSARSWVDVIDTHIYASAVKDPNHGRQESYPFVFDNESLVDASPSLVPTSAPFANIIETPTTLTSSTPSAPSAAVCGENEYLYVVRMRDTWGDGWAGTFMTITKGVGTTKTEYNAKGARFSEVVKVHNATTMDPVFHETLQDGVVGQSNVCLEVGICYDIGVDGGQWQEEVKWDIREATENSVTLAKGLAPMKCQFSIPNRTTGEFGCEFICETSTKFPTKAPIASGVPSDAPSLVPFSYGTLLPTKSQEEIETDPPVAFQEEGDSTSDYSAMPSDAPSFVPSTDLSTVLATPVPSHSESASPTGGSPTASPVGLTGEPTNGHAVIEPEFSEETNISTNSPSNGPSLARSSVPSATPTNPPSVGPSFVPSDSPSIVPSMATSEPSDFVETRQPTLTPVTFIVETASEIPTTVTGHAVLAPHDFVVQSDQPTSAPDSFTDETASNIPTFTGHAVLEPADFVAETILPTSAPVTLEDKPSDATQPSKSPSNVPTGSPVSLEEEIVSSPGPVDSSIDSATRPTFLTIVDSLLELDSTAGPSNFPSKSPSR